jgi:uncharacterized protein (DUF4213/DUF364 family)
MIIDELLAEAEPRLTGRTITDLRIGLGYTAVLLDDGGCGLAGTLLEGARGCCTLLERAGELIDTSALDLAEYARSRDPVASSVGVATLNAAVNRAGEAGPSPLEILPVDGATVGVVGYFEPFLPELKRRAKVLYVFERRPLAEEILPDWAAERLLPTCDVAIITSLALVNETLDHLLELAKGEVALVGPTTPLSTVFGHHGVGHLFGSVVTDPDGVLTIVSQAGGTQRFKGTTKKVYLSLKGD